MNKQEIIQFVTNKYQKKKHKDFRVGDTVRVHVRIKEGNTTRIQVFEGVVISIKGEGDNKNFTARKISFGVGVERIFTLHSPTVDKIQIVRSSHVRRAKLYYLRSRVGRASRLEEKERNETSKSKGTKAEKAVKENNPKELVTAPQKS